MYVIWSYTLVGNSKDLIRLDKTEKTSSEVCVAPSKKDNVAEKFFGWKKIVKLNWQSVYFTA